jgi:FAD/FMN-containing dehydrogenase
MARSGGHGYAASFGKLQNGLSLDLSKFNTVEIDSAAQTLTVGPGARYRDILDPLYDAGFYIRKYFYCRNYLQITYGSSH